MLIKDSLKSIGEWRIGRVEGQIVGKDGVVGGYRMRPGNGYIVE